MKGVSIMIIVTIINEKFLVNVKQKNYAFDLTNLYRETIRFVTTIIDV